MTRPVITALPPAPLRGEDAATFAAKANTFVAALPAYGTESNALGVFMENEADAAEVSRIAAEAAETGAEAAETAAQAAQAAAEAASNATEWVSGQAYVEGDVVWSPINYLSYRAVTSTSGTTDPSLSADWTSLGVSLPVSVANGGTGLSTLGTAGQVLAVNSGATDLEYIAPPAPSPAGWTLLSTVTASASATVDVETTFDSTFDVYAIVANNVLASSDASVLSARLKISGTYQTSGYFTLLAGNMGGSMNAARNNTAESIPMNIALTSSASNRGINFEMRIINPASTTTQKQIYFGGTDTARAANDNHMVMLQGVARFNDGNGALTGVRFLLSTGDIATGSFRLYGIRK